MRKNWECKSREQDCWKKCHKLKNGKTCLRANRNLSKVRRSFLCKRGKAVLCQTNQLWSNLSSPSLRHSKTTKTQTLKRTTIIQITHTNILPPTSCFFNANNSTSPTLIFVPNHNRNLIQNPKQIINAGSHDYGAYGNISSETNDKTRFLTERRREIDELIFLCTSLLNSFLSPIFLIESHPIYPMQSPILFFLNLSI